MQFDPIRRGNCMSRTIGRCVTPCQIGGFDGLAHASCAAIHALLSPSEAALLPPGEWVSAAKCGKIHGFRGRAAGRRVSSAGRLLSTHHSLIRHEPHVPRLPAHPRHTARMGFPPVSLHDRVREFVVFQPAAHPEGRHGTDYQRGQPRYAVGEGVARCAAPTLLKRAWPGHRTTAQTAIIWPSYVSTGRDWTVFSTRSPCDRSTNDKNVALDATRGDGL